MDKEKSYVASISEILPAFDENSQSFYVEAIFKEELTLKISGAQLQANIIVGEKKGALVIPKLYMDYGNKVLVKGGNEPVVIKTGFISGEWIEVLEGLSEGDYVLLNTKK